MKILFVNYEYYPQGGGAGLATHNIAKAFADRGHQVGVLCGWDPSLGELARYDRIDYYTINIKKRNIHQSSVIGLMKFVAIGLNSISRLTHKQKWDIVFFFFSVPTGILKYGIKGKIPYVVSLRGMDIPGLNTLDYSLLTQLTKGLNKSIVSDSAATLCLSKAGADVYNLLLPNKKIHVIPNAIDSSKYKKKEEYSERICNFVTVSRLIKVKRIDILIKAFTKAHSKNDDITLDIYGEGREYDYLQNVIKELGAEGFIFLRGYKKGEELADILHMYDAFALVSVGDSFGVVYLQAMACGLPVICANSGGPAEIIRDKYDGLVVEPNSVDSTYYGIEYLIKHPKEAGEMGKRAVRTVEEKYSIDKIVDEHMIVLERALKSRQ